MRLFLLFAWMLSPVFAGGWSQFRGPELNGISRETNWMTAWPTDAHRQTRTLHEPP
jgi:hypothetical protein